MEIFIDNDAAELSGSTLGEMITAARKHLEPTGRMVVEVRLDGRTLNAAEFDEQCDETMTAEEVQFITADPYELARQTLLDVRDALGDAREAQQKAAEQLQADRATEAMDSIRQALGVWQQAQQSVLQSAQLLNVSLEDIQVGARGVAAVVDELSGMLTQLREQLGNQDFLGVADTLAYPLAEAVDTWCELIDAMCARIAEKKNT